MKMLDTMPPYNLFGIEEQNYDKAKVVVMPVPYDATTTYRPGTRDGPHALIDASRTIEFYSEETGYDIRKIGIYTAEEMAPDLSGPEHMVKRIEKEVSLVLDDKKMSMLLGGEHTISIGAIAALAKRDKSFSILQLDAHADSYDIYMNAKHCHATVMARARELCGSCYGVGIRSADEPSIRKHGTQMLFMKDMREMNAKDIVKSILSNTKDNIYLTIDLDVLDPSEMPSVGTPEPGGMSFNQLVDVIKGVVRNRNIIGLDIVELCPIPGLVAPNYLAAKLAYMTLSCAFKTKH